MKIPVYLKTSQEYGAVLVGTIELFPSEWDMSTVVRQYRRPEVEHVFMGPQPVQVYQVHMTVRPGPYGVPYATQIANTPGAYTTAVKFWRERALLGE